LQSLDDFGITHQADKHHILLLGKSGSGKTLMATTIAKLFNLPYAMGDATNYSPTGFHGSDADSIIQDLLIETDMNFELAERGVLFIDEIDKICCSNKNAGKYESFIGSTQSTLLKLIEGKIVKVPGQAFGEPPGSSFNIDSSRMLFFFGGAFNGLAEIIAKKMGKTEKTMGFITKHDAPKNKEIDDALKSYEIFSNASREEMVDALIEFGMLAELVGRIPTIAPLKPLSKEELMEVLLKSTVSPVEKQKNIFEKSGFNLTFSEEFLNKIVDLSYNSATGTRALDSYVKLAVSIASFDLLTLSKNKSAKGNIIIGEACITDPSLYEKSKLHIGNTAISTSAAI
jgi:ATP-dependent Clp protease ATP-binding subunit ClpX